MAIEDDIAALERALATGALEVEYDDQRVKYRSRNEIVATIRSLKRQAGLITSGGGVHYPEFDKGTC